MGNCTSKKSAKSLKLSVKGNTVFDKKMEKDPDFHSKGLSKKIAPFTKGEITSFGFKKKPPSQLPVPVTLTSSNGHAFAEHDDNMLTKAAADHQTVMNEGYQSGSSVESLCHAPFRSTPKMIRKRDVVRQQKVSSAYASDKENNSANENIVKSAKASITQSTTFQTSNKPAVTAPSHGEDNNRNAFNKNSNVDLPINRFGFRQPAAIKSKEAASGKANKNNALPISRCSILNSQGPIETGSRSRDNNSQISSRSKSEGPREAFFKQILHPANSEQNGLNHSKAVQLNNNQPGKFTFQTSHLPRPQVPVKMSNTTKTAKTAANYYRRGGIRSESNSSKEGSANEDSGFESHPSANNTLERRIEILDSSPGCKVRKRLPACKGKKLEMKIVGNKFELLKEDEKSSPDVVTEVSVIKLPICNGRSSTSIINTGLVEQRTNQYLKKISQPFVSNKKDSNIGSSELQKVESKIKAPLCQNNHEEENHGAESEEEKLYKDSSRSEKLSDKFSMSDGFEELESMMPGEAMAEDFSLCLKDLSFTEDLSGIDLEMNKIEKPVMQVEVDVTPNTIRLDALKLSKELKRKNGGPFAPTIPSKENQKNDSHGLLWEKDEETFCSDSILEQLSSDSDSLGDKGENKNNDKEKNLKMSLEKKESEAEIDDEDGNLSSKSDTDIDDNELELNVDLSDAKEGTNNCLGSTSPDSPCTPTHGSNSLSISEGRDFLIDDEIADQPPLCFSEKFVEMSCQENVKAENEKTLTSVQEFETCQQSNFSADANGEQTPKNVGNDEEMEKVDVAVNEVNRERSRKRLNSEGTLSPCESIASDDLMLDFETNSFDETGGRPQDLNENVPTENKQVSNNETVRDLSSQNYNLGGGGVKSQRRRDSSSGRSTPASVKSVDVVNHVGFRPLQSSRSSLIDEDSVRLDKTTYHNVFQDVISMKAMLLKLKRLLSENEGNIQENGVICTNERIPDNIIEDELTDLRRQVLFLQQQLEDREKTVQILKLKIDKTTESRTAVESKELSNATTQTGTEQFQKEFPHFRNFRATPVV